MMPEPTPTPAPTPQEPTTKDSVAVAAALAGLTVFAVFTFYLLCRLSMTELQWTRAVYLLSGIEAIVFAGAGYLFGKDVHRQQAVSAERRANAAETVANQNRQKAAAGEALAGAVKARAAVRTTADKDGQSTDVEDLARIAGRLFPGV